MACLLMLLLAERIVGNLPDGLVKVEPIVQQTGLTMYSDVHASEPGENQYR